MWETCQIVEILQTKDNKYLLTFSRTNLVNDILQILLPMTKKQAEQYFGVSLGVTDKFALGLNDTMAVVKGKRGGNVFVFPLNEEGEG